MIELWIVLLLYGGGVMDDLKLLRARGVRRLFGWVQIPDATTFGRWLRRAGEPLVGVLDRLLWLLVQQRWAAAGTPTQLMLVVDSTVVLRYGVKQAGAEVGYNPKKHGRPSHHPLVAFAAETGDCLGVLWRPGSAHTAAGSIPWIRTIVGRLRGLGVQEITVRLDKGFFLREMVEALSELGVRYFLKVRNTSGRSGSSAAGGNPTRIRGSGPRRASCTVRVCWPVNGARRSGRSLRHRTNCRSTHTRSINWRWR